MSEELNNEVQVESAETRAEDAVGNFRSSLSEELQGEASLADFKDVNGLAKSYVNAQRMLGSSVRIPGEDASPEAREEFYQKMEAAGGLMRKPDLENPESVNHLYNQLGRPEEASGYQAELPEGLEFDSEALGQFNQLAHEAGLTNSQYKQMLNVYSQEKLAEAEFQAQTSEQFLDQAKQMWGGEFQQRAEAAKAVKDMYMEKYPEAMKALVNGPNGNNPALLSMLAELSGTFQEKGMVGSSTKHQFGTSPEEAKEKITEIMANKSHAYWTGDRAAVERVNKLYSIAYGE
jgi:hypothetical protein